MMMIYTNLILKGGRNWSSDFSLVQTQQNARNQWRGVAPATPSRRKGEIAYS